jgi:dethiobiotin synthetase
MNGLFITGTDTGCGKTHVSAELILALREHGKRVAPFKPVAAGAVRNGGEWQNDDALTLIEAAGSDWDYRDVNPYCYEAAVSPHLASRDVNLAVELPEIRRTARALAARSDCVVAEGAGGWMVPLADHLDISDVALALELPVILVVGLRLGCLNHARLSEFAILQSGVRLGGWIASQVDPDMERVAENLETLHDKLRSPCLGVLPWQGEGQLQTEQLLALVEN